ncbi:hypothetical protein CKAH01_01547 [Colletotrichum kahawae]|uniref:Uncharacterized protein n=1 Tax=Colletotrichum kahawae TaxID=34407 RepID=A0AAD9Y5Y7_COLKA|nr:hypothetical protein CKAH01_01547 [Colletotrichum kahawae]
MNCWWRKEGDRPEEGYFTALHRRDLRPPSATPSMLMRIGGLPQFGLISARRQSRMTETEHRPCGDPECESLTSTEPGACKTPHYAASGRVRLARCISSKTSIHAVGGDTGRSRRARDWSEWAWQWHTSHDPHLAARAEQSRRNSIALSLLLPSSRSSTTSITGPPSPPRPPAVPSSTPDHTQVQGMSFEIRPAALVTMPVFSARAPCENFAMGNDTAGNWGHGHDLPEPSSSSIPPPVPFPSQALAYSSGKTFSDFLPLQSLQAVSEMLFCRSVDCYGYDTNVVQSTELPGSLLATLCLSKCGHCWNSFQKLKTGQVIHNKRPCSHPVSAQAGGTWHYTSLLTLPIAGLDISSCALHLLSGRCKADESRYHATILSSSTFIFSQTQNTTPFERLQVSGRYGTAIRLGRLLCRRVHIVSVSTYRVHTQSSVGVRSVLVLPFRVGPIHVLRGVPTAHSKRQDRPSSYAEVCGLSTSLGGLDRSI